jgi:dTDP-4-dehydrorhamnose 3,5-epimerase
MFQVPGWRTLLYFPWLLDWTQVYALPQSEVYLLIEESPISGVKIVRDIAVVHDDRGSFRTWWRADWPDPDIAGIRIEQANLSHNARKGTTRGSHVAPWDKYAHVLAGSALAVIIDARPGSTTFGTVESFTLDESSALFIPHGCGHAYQTAVDDVVYAYAVNELWFRGDQETAISLFDPRFAAVPWPIGDRSSWIVSQKDRESEFFDDLFPAT